MWPNISNYSEEALDPSVLNRPVNQLKQRTDYLKQRLDAAYAAGDNSSVIFANVTLVAGTFGLPELGDVVHMSSSGGFNKARADIRAEGSYSSADDNALATGIVINTYGDTGDVLSYGLLVNSGVAPAFWTSLTEDGSSLTSGHYYLSSSVAGKLTRSPTGPAVYIGYFSVPEDNTGMATAFIHPIYKDVYDAHSHCAFALKSMPVGEHVITGNELPADGAHSITGFNPSSQAELAHGTHTGGDATSTLVDSTAEWVSDNLEGLTITNVTTGLSGFVISNTATEIETDVDVLWNTDDEYKIQPRCRLSIAGEWSSTVESNYTLTLTDSTGINAPDSGTLGFENVWLGWTSSDPEEGSSLVRLLGYGIPVSIGTKGLTAVLECAIDDYITVERSTLNRRTWEISAPEQICGWRTRNLRGYMSSTEHEDAGVSLVAFADRLNGDYGTELQVTVATGTIKSLDYTDNPEPSDTLTFNGQVFIFTADGSTPDENIIAVRIADTADGTYRSLLSALLEYSSDLQHVALDITNQRMFFALNSTTDLTEDITNASITTALANPAADFTGATKPTFLVYDTEHNVAIDNDSGLWELAEFYTPITLRSGLMLMFTPYAQDGTTATDVEVDYGFSWSGVIYDAAPGALFEYSVLADPLLKQHFPPSPIASAALVINGFEQAAYHLFPEQPAYRVSYNGLFWYIDRYGVIPWPIDWTSTLNSGQQLVQAVLYTVRRRLGDTSVVTSLKNAEDSNIEFVRCGTNTPASTGDLEARLKLTLGTDDDNVDGHIVFKQLRGNKLLTGPVVSEILPGPGVTVDSAFGVQRGRGRVTIGVSSNYGLSGEISDIAFNNAKQEMIGKFPYVKLLGWNSLSSNNIRSGFTGKFTVPHDLTGSYQLAVYMTVFGLDNIPQTTGRLRAGLKLSYAILRNYDPSDETFGTLVDDLITPQSDALVSIPFGTSTPTDYSGTPLTYKAYDPMIVHNNPSDPLDNEGRIVRALGGLIPSAPALKGGITVSQLAPLLIRPGSMVALELQRAGVSNTATEYTGAVGIMSMRWKLIKV